MNAAEDALTYTMRSWEQEIEDCNKDIKRQRDSIAFAETQISKCEERIWTAELHISVLKDAIRRLNESYEHE